MKKIALLFLFLAGTNVVLFAGKNQMPTQSSITSRDIVSKMLSNIKADKTFAFNLQTWERINGKDHYNNTDVKLQVNPHRLYMHSNAEPNKNVEILYNTALYGTKAKVNPGKFLPTLSMDPYGSRMLKDQHHTFLSSGFEVFYNIISNAVAKADKEAPGKFETYFKYDGDVNWNGRSCYQITITDPTFTYVDYTAKKGETVLGLENKLSICGWLIVEKNNLGGLDGLREGMTIKIPTSYAKKTVLYIDKESYLPIVQDMSDEKGRFERYEFHDLKVNPTITDQEFTTDYSGYKF